MRAPRAKPVWLLNGPAVGVFAADPAARRYLAGAKPFVIRRRDDPSELPGAWEAVTVRSFTSCADIARADAAGGFGDDAGAVLYDAEAWRFTPVAERRDHANVTRRAADVVHARGLRFITAPAVNLARDLPGATARRYEDFLGAGFAADAARHADVFDIQAQGSERDVPRFASFVERAARQARDANAAVTVLAGISTNPEGSHVEAVDLLRAIRAVRHAVDGFWFNVPRPSAYAPRVTAFRPDVALAVFAALDAELR